MEKVCFKCKEKKDISHFDRDSQKRDGYTSSCKKCNRIFVDRVNIEIEDLSNEIWLPIIGYEESYRVSNKGRIKTLNREIPNKGGVYQTPHWAKAILLKQFKTGNMSHRYLAVRLYSNKKYKDYSVHFLIGMHFVENPRNLKDINHKDHDKFNNNDWNLEWVTKRENCTHRSNAKPKTSSYTGVSWSKRMNKWISQIDISGSHETLGFFSDEIEASNAYIDRLKEIQDVNRYALVPI